MEKYGISSAQSNQLSRWIPVNVSSKNTRVSWLNAEFASKATGIELGNIRAEAYRIHLMKLFALAAVLEAIFLRMALLGDLRTRIVETIALLLASGLFYLVSTHLVLRGWAPIRPAWIIAAAVLFRLTLWPDRKSVV